jgi:hypothetical protein
MALRIVENEEDPKALLAAKVDVLKGLVSLLPKKDQEFAKSLCDQYQQKGHLSMRQWPWVETMIARATKTERAPKIEGKTINGFESVFALFKHAQKTNKYPKIILKIGDRKLALSIAGPNSAYPGCINVASPSFGEKYYGKVTPKLEWLPHKSINHEENQWIIAFLEMFALDPAGSVKAHGIQTGVCCFCNSQLTDKKSIAAGYGPVCAKTFGFEELWKQATDSVAE